MKMSLSERWFKSRANQSLLQDLPRMPVLAMSNKAMAKKGGPPTRGAKMTKSFIVGESLVGDDEVAISTTRG